MESLSTDSFLLAFTRFVAKNNRPIRVRSDNGAQLVAADRELSSLWPQLNQQAFKQRFPEVEWVFNTPRNAHSGGFFERLIQSFKRAFYATVRQALTWEEFVTVTASIQASLNNRPITKPDPNDPNSAELLTPNHFIAGSAFTPLATIPHGTKPSVKQRWRMVMHLLDENWRRFIEELLPHYHHLNRWQRDTPNLQENDLVVCLQAKNRGRYPIARVVEARASPRDGVVRAVVIQFRGRKYERPAHALLRIEPMLSDPVHGLQPRHQPQEDDLQPQEL